MSPAPSAPPVDQLNDQRVLRVRPLASPALLKDRLPLTDQARDVVLRGRRDVVDVLTGRDERLLAVVGPCSVHDPAAALDYATRLAALAEEVRDQVLVVMRVYFEKPRTTLGWKGLINDPGLDGSYQVNEGLTLARQLLLDVLALGLPVGCEFLDPITPQYIADTVSWGSIGARTAQSQVHRQLSSGLSMPIGIKNSTEGDVQSAVDAVRSAAAEHVFTGINEDGQAAILSTTGNEDCHVVLRGSAQGPNYDAASVRATLERLAAAGLPERVVVDASHGNSGKDHRRQPVVVADLARRLAGGERGVRGVMLESFLEEGNQPLADPASLVYGRSVTDACLGWPDTADVLRTLAATLRAADPTRSGAGTG